MSTKIESTPQPNAPSGVFVSTLSALHGGKVLDDLDDVLREVTIAANASQKKASIILELTVTPNGVGVGDAPLYKITEDIKKKVPKKGRQAQTFFADENFNLTRRNPAQEEIRWSLVSGGAKPADVPQAAQPKAVSS